MMKPQIMASPKTNPNETPPCRDHRRLDGSPPSTALAGLGGGPPKLHAKAEGAHYSIVKARTRTAR
jgi:hypothetical protein